MLQRRLKLLLTHFPVTFPHFFISDPKNENQNETPSEHILSSFPQSSHSTSSYCKSLQTQFNSISSKIPMLFFTLKENYSTPVTPHNAKCMRSNNNHLMLVCQQTNNEAPKISGVFNSPITHLLTQITFVIFLTAHWLRRQWKRSL